VVKSGRFSKKREGEDERPIHKSHYNRHKLMYSTLSFIVVWLGVAMGFFYIYTKQWAKSQNKDILLYNNELSQNATGTLGKHQKKLVKGWSIAMCFYYAVQAGFSVGFGALSDVDDWSRLYTSVHVMFGASLISAALTVFTMSIMDQSDKLRSEIQNTVITDNTKKLKKFNRRSNWRGFVKRVMTSVGLLKSVFVLLCWLGGGAYFAVYKWKMSYIGSAYFAITALSTGGLQAPGSTDDTSMWVVGCFVLVGVPLFGLVVGNAASVLVAPVLEKMFLRKFEMASKLDVPSFLKALKGGDDDVLTYGEYLEFCMMRAYDAKEAQVDKLRKTFKAMDLSDDGRITRHEANNWVQKQAMLRAQLV